MVSKKGMEASSLLSSTVNLMTGSTLLMCWRKPCLLTSLWMTKVSSTNLQQNLGVCGEQCLELFVLSTPCRGWLQWDWLGNLWLHRQPVHRTGLGRKSRMFLRQNSKRRMMLLTSITILSLRVWSFSIRSFMMFRAGSTGTEVNKADTS